MNRLLMSPWASDASNSKGYVWDDVDRSQHYNREYNTDCKCLHMHFTEFMSDIPFRKPPVSMLGGIMRLSRT